MWCQMSSLLPPLPPARSVYAFGRTTATSACAMITKRQAHTQQIHWASPCQSATHLYNPCPPALRRSFLKLPNMVNCVRRKARFIWIFSFGERLGGVPCGRRRIKEVCLRKGEDRWVGGYMQLKLLISEEWKKKDAFFFHSQCCHCVHYC